MPDWIARLMLVTARGGSCSVLCISMRTAGVLFTCVCVRVIKELVGDIRTGLPLHYRRKETHMPPSSSMRKHTSSEVVCKSNAAKCVEDIQGLLHRWSLPSKQPSLPAVRCMNCVR